MPDPKRPPPLVVSFVLPNPVPPEPNPPPAVEVVDPNEKGFDCCCWLVFCPNKPPLPEPKPPLVFPDPKPVEELLAVPKRLPLVPDEEAALNRPPGFGPKRVLPEFDVPNPPD